MSKLFNKKKVLKAFVGVNKFASEMLPIFELNVLFLKVVKKVCESDAVKESVCTGLKVICDVVEVESIKVFEKHKDEFEFDIRQIISKAGELDKTKEDKEEDKDIH